MGQRIERWHGEDGEQRWLWALIAAMEEASRPEVRAEPCPSAILNACRAQLMLPAGGRFYPLSPVRH